nr:hypothetical protein [Tanacetum cinerariifolium]
MSNTNNNLQTQTSNALHNAIMKERGKDRPPMLAPGIDNNIYSTVDACPNACEMWKAIERPQQAATRNRGKAIINSSPPTYNQKPEMVVENDALSKENKIDKLIGLISLSFKKIYKPTNNNFITSSNTSRANQDDTLRIKRGTGYDNQKAINVAGAKENLQADWMDVTYDEPEAQELEAHYLYMAQIQEVTPDVVDNSGPIFVAEPLQKVQNNDDNYNVFANDREHPEQPESVNVIYLDKHDDTNITTDSLDMRNNGEEADQDEDEDDNDHDLARERDLLASLIEKLKCEIDESKDHAQNVIIESEDLNYDSDQIEQNDEDEPIAHQETIFIMSQEKEAQKKFYKTRKDKEIEKVFALENKFKVLDDIVYKTGQSVQTMNMLNRKCKTRFFKSEFLKKSQRENPRMYDIESSKGKKYVLVIVDDYPRYTWTHFLRSKDKTPEVIIDFLKLIQRGLHAQVRTVQTDKGTEFLNKTLHAYFAQEGIEHQTSTARTPEQNGAEAIAIACFTQNRSLVIHRHEKTPYHIINGRKPSVKLFYIFGSLCYIVRDGESLDKMKEKAETVTTSNELDFLFSPMFDELLNGTNLVMSKSSVVHVVDAPDQCQQHNITTSTLIAVAADTPPLNIQTNTSQAPTQAPTVIATENINQAETQGENTQVDKDEFINIFSTPIHEKGETSSHHPLEQVIGNPSQSIKTRRQLEKDGELCMFALIASQTKPKNIKEAMADSAWIEVMQEEIHQFKLLDIWELVDRPLCKNVINMKWLWKKTNVMKRIL